MSHSELVSDVEIRSFGMVNLKDCTLKRYRWGPVLQQALAKVKADLGPEAVYAQQPQPGPRRGRVRAKRSRLRRPRDVASPAWIPRSGPIPGEPNDYLGKIQEDLAHLRALMTINASKKQSDRPVSGQHRTATVLRAADRRRGGRSLGPGFDRPRSGPGSIAGRRRRRPGPS